MKPVLIIFSILCLSFTFTKDYFDDKIATPQEDAIQTPEQTVSPLSGAKTTSVLSVVTAALAFKASLTASQQSTLELSYTSTLARKWSNLPCGASCRNGIQFGTLTSAQLQLQHALAVIKEATGPTANDGYDEFAGIRLSEAVLKSSGGGSGYDTTLRWIAFLNTPSASGGWMLQFGGHHYAANIAYNSGHVVGATPFFMGLSLNRSTSMAAPTLRWMMSKMRWRRCWLR